MTNWDEAIEKTERLISEPRLQAESCRWKKVKLGDLFKFGRGRVISKQEIESNSGDFPVYSSQTANNGVLGNSRFYPFSQNTTANSRNTFHSSRGNRFMQKYIREI